MGQEGETYARVAKLVPCTAGMQVPFWAAGYCVSTVDLDEARVRKYIREQQELEGRQGELDLE